MIQRVEQFKPYYMKNILKLAIIALAVNSAVAQNNPAPAGSKISAEEKQELKKMRKDLNLSDEQKAKIKEIHRERKANKEARKAMSKEARKEANQKDKAKVDEILNDQQDVKMTEIRKKRREFRKN